MILSERDRRIARELREFGVFEDIDPNQMVDQTNGLFCVVCSDGDQFPDIYTLHVNLMRKHRDIARPHMFCDHGTPLLIPLESPLNQNGRGNNLLESIGKVPGIKEISSGAFHPHAPCAAATEANLDVAHQVAIVKASKHIAYKLFPNLAIVSFFQVDNGKKRSYRINGDVWREYLTTKGFSRQELRDPEEIVRILLKHPISI